MHLINAVITFNRYRFDKLFLSLRVCQGIINLKCFKKRDAIKNIIKEAYGMVEAVACRCSSK